MDQLKELENTSRIVRNIQNLISDCEIKGNMAVAVSEAVSFLDAFQKNLELALENLRYDLKRQADGKHETVKAVENEPGLLPSIGKEQAPA